MKKVLVVILTLVAASFLTAATTAYTNTETTAFKNDHGPDDIKVLNIYTTATVSARDTFAAADIHIHGPYPLSAAEGTGMFSGFQLIADAITGTTPTMSFDYQVLPTNDLKDTTAWTASDTLGTTAKNVYHSLSSLAGKSIVFRINNYDGTECQIPKKLTVIFKENFTWQRRF